MSFNPDELWRYRGDFRKAERRIPWGKIAVFMVGAWVVGKILPDHPGIRMLAFIVGMILFIQWLEKKP